MQEVTYINRETSKEEKERILHGDFIRWVYENPVGKISLGTVFKKKWFSYVYGKFQDTELSSRNIKQFIEEYSIDMEECTKSEKDFKTFNEFFTRKLKKEARLIATHKHITVCPADSKVMVFQKINVNYLFQIKGSFYKLEELLKGSYDPKAYENGSYAVFRLAPSDCHWFHFIDDGYAHKSVNIKGKYYCLNKLSLTKIADLYCKNKRAVTKFESKTFGEVLYVEVGATGVGSVLQTFTVGDVKKGDEKGFFKFGGSTILLFFKENRIKFCGDLTLNTQKGLETKVKFGTPLGYKY